MKYFMRADDNTIYLSRLETFYISSLAIKAFIVH